MFYSALEVAFEIIISRLRAIRGVTKACVALTRTCAACDRGNRVVWDTMGRMNRMVWEYYGTVRRAVDGEGFCEGVWWWGMVDKNEGRPEAESVNCTPLRRGGVSEFRYRCIHPRPRRCSAWSQRVTLLPASEEAGVLRNLQNKFRNRTNERSEL